MSLVYDTSTWCRSLWKGHLRYSQHARALINQGQAKQKHFDAFADDVHADLYLKNQPVQLDAPAWATNLLNQAHELAEWKTLRARCARNGFAAAVGTEALIEALVPLLPEPPTQRPQDGAGSTNGTGQPGTQGQAPEQASAQRRALRQAMRQATQAVDEAEASTESMADALGIHAGTGPGHAETMHDLNQVRQLWALLRDNPTMRHIAALAGRLKRLGEAHKKCQVTPAVGRIKGITLGGDLDRILPSELAGLRSPHRIQRLATLGRIMGKCALQYEMQGEETLTRGPIVVCVDESHSMRGEAELWSKAVCLALLQTATEQKRAWHMIGFNWGVTHQHHLEAGQANARILLEALQMRASGGTDFDEPLRQAVLAVRTYPDLQRADLIFLTDGAGHLAPQVVDEINHLRHESGLHVYVIGVGGASADSLKPIADAIYRVSARADEDSGTIAPVVALLG